MNYSSCHQSIKNEWQCTMPIEPVRTGAFYYNTEKTPLRNGWKFGDDPVWPCTARPPVLIFFRASLLLCRIVAQVSGIEQKAMGKPFICTFLSLLLSFLQVLSFVSFLLRFLQISSRFQCAHTLMQLAMVFYPSRLLY